MLQAFPIYVDFSDLETILYEIVKWFWFKTFHTNEHNECE